MQFFKDEDDNNKVYRYEDDVAEKYIKEGLTAITEEEKDTLLNPPPTAEEIEAQKWKDFYSYCEGLIVEIENKNKYTITKQSILEIDLEMKTMNDTAISKWIEPWGTQMSTKADFQEAFNEYRRLKDIKLSELFGV